MPRDYVNEQLPPVAGSDSAPAADDLLVEGHRLADALHAAVLVGLVRELRLARAEHHGWRASIHLQQVARIGVVRGGARLWLRAEMAPADLEHASHPFIFGRGPYRRHVGEHVELGFFFQKLSYFGEQGLVVHPGQRADIHADDGCVGHHVDPLPALEGPDVHRSEEHTSELQSHHDLHPFPTRRSSDLAPIHLRARSIPPACRRTRRAWLLLPEAFLFWRAGPGGPSRAACGYPRR